MAFEDYHDGQYWAQDCEEMGMDGPPNSAAPIKRKKRDDMNKQDDKAEVVALVPRTPETLTINLSTSAMRVLPKDEVTLSSAQSAMQT